MNYSIMYFVNHSNNEKFAIGMIFMNPTGDVMFDVSPTKLLFVGELYPELKIFLNFNIAHLKRVFKLLPADEIVSFINDSNKKNDNIEYSKFKFIDATFSEFDTYLNKWVNVECNEHVYDGKKMLDTVENEFEYYRDLYNKYIGTPHEQKFCYKMQAVRDLLKKLKSI